MLGPTSAIMGAGLGSECALITDGRFSGGSHGFVIGHVTPEAQEGGGLALVQNGDIIAIDAAARTIDAQIPEEVCGMVVVVVVELQMPLWLCLCLAKSHMFLC